MMNPRIVPGNFKKDPAGDFAIGADKVKYQARTEQPEDLQMHGWQGHKKTQKWFHAEKGSFLVLVVQPDNWESPSFNLKPMEFILRDDRDETLHVPGGYVTGFKAIEPGSKLLISSEDSEDSSTDNYHFDKERWYYETFM